MLLNPYVFAAGAPTFPVTPFIDLDPTDAAYDGILDGGDINSPVDSSGNGNTITIGDSAFKPKLSTSQTLNGKRTFLFPNDHVGIATGDKYYWKLPDLSAWVSGEGFAIFKLRYDPGTTNELGAGLWNLGSHDIANALPYQDGNCYDDFGSTVRKGFSSGGNGNWNNQFVLYNAVSKSGDWRAYKNGTSLHTTATNTVGFHNVPAVGISNNPSGIYYLSAYVARFLFFTPALSDTDRTTITGILQALYGI